MVVAEMMGQRAATLLVPDQDNLDAVPGEKADGGLVDARRQHLLGAALQQRDPAPPLAERREHAAGSGAPRGQPVRRQRQHRLDTLDQPGRGGGARRRQEDGERTSQPRQPHARAKTPGVRQDKGQHLAQQPLGERPLIALFNPNPGLVDEVHVVHPRRASRHAGQARQAAVDMLDHLGRRRLVLLQHLLDQIDAAAWTIELVAEQDIGRTSRRAEAAMDAGAQDLVGFGDVGVGELCQ
ncbi:hypothetical protein ABIF81_005719 [Bradyrhizobium daqingense]